MRSTAEEFWWIAEQSGDTAGQALMEEKLIEMLGPLRGSKAIESFRIKGFIIVVGDLDLAFPALDL